MGAGVRAVGSRILDEGPIWSRGKETRNSILGTGKYKE